jgi:hypothetical protein
MTRYELQITTDRGMVMGSIINTEAGDRIVEDLPSMTESEFVLKGVISDWLAKKQEWNDHVDM